MVVTPYTVTYNGSPHTATVTSITGVDGQTGATVGTVTLKTTTRNAGTYASDSWSFAGTANYNSIASTTITDTIGKANATVVVTPYTVTYNGSPHTATVTSITGVDGQTGATVGTVTLKTTHTAAGTYASDSWSFAGTANYNRHRQHDDHRYDRQGERDGGGHAIHGDLQRESAHGDGHVDHRCGWSRPEPPWAL